jgi:hypothetical protein
MTTPQELALEAMSAFLVCHNTLEKLHQRYKRNPEENAAILCPILALQIALIIYTQNEWQALGEVLEVDMNLPLYQLRRSLRP